MSKKPTDPVARFWSKVDQDGPVVSDLGPCWQWLGKPHKSGYGRHLAEGGVVYAHRFSYEHLVRSIPGGLQLDHLCRNTMCVRPDHLEAVTQRVNGLRSMSPAAKNARKTECPKGHALDDNAYTWIGLNGNTHRRCRECNTENARAYRARVAARRVAA